MQLLNGSEKDGAMQWMMQAADVAKRSLCLRAKCGTIVVNDQNIIGTGYNAPPLDQEEHRLCLQEFSVGKPKYDKTCCMHAEWRAIMDALKRHPQRLPKAKLYFTRIDAQGSIKKSGKPFCTVCSRLALDAGIAEFLLWHEEGICTYPTNEYNRLSYRYHE